MALEPSMVIVGHHVDPIKVFDDIRNVVCDINSFVAWRQGCAEELVLCLEPVAELFDQEVEILLVVLRIRALPGARILLHKDASFSVVCPKH